MRKTHRFGELTIALVLVFFAASFSLAQDPQPATSPAPALGKPTAEAEAPKLAANENATIYFYRIKQFAGSALEPSVYCDGKELARMDNGRYFGVTLQPGTHTCTMGDKQTGFEIDAKAGEEYYAKVTLDVGFWKGRGRLNLLQKEQGAFELKKVKLLGADKIKDRSLVTIFEGSEKTGS
jgi:hypothetical protein